MITALVGQHLELLDATPRLVGGEDHPTPHAGELEAESLPSAERIAAAGALCLTY